MENCGEVRGFSFIYIYIDNMSEPECSSKGTNNSLTSTLTSLGQQKRLSERRQGELAELYRSRQSKQDEI